MMCVHTGTWYHKRLFGMLCVRNKRVTKYVRTEFQATSDDAKIAANEMDLNLLCIKQATTTATATTERWYQGTVPLVVGCTGTRYRYQQIKLVDIRWGSHTKVLVLRPFLGCSRDWYLVAVNFTRCLPQCW